jgi:hypothetical protein
MRIWKKRKEQVPVLLFIVSISSPAYPSAWLRPLGARFRFAWQDHCSLAPSISLNFRTALRLPAPSIVESSRRSPEAAASAILPRARMLCTQSTVKGTLLESVPLFRVTTSTVPVVAPVGTAVVISELETTVNVAALPLKVTPGRACQVGPQNLDSASGGPGGSLCFHKWAKTNRKAEDCAGVVGPAAGRCPE